MKLIFCMLQIDSMILMGMVKHSQSSQNSKFAISFTISQKRSERWSWFFACRFTSKFPKNLFEHFGHEIFLQGLYYHWCAWSSILKSLKVTGSQYLYNLSKKKLGMEFIFGMEINTKLLQVVLLWCKAFRYFMGVQSCWLLLVYSKEWIVAQKFQERCQTKKGKIFSSTVTLVSTFCLLITTANI